MGELSPETQNLLIYLVVWLVGLGGLLAGYKVGGESWREEFSIKPRVPGWWGEVAFLSFGIVLVFFVEQVIVEISVLSLVTEFTGYAIGILIVVFMIVVGYSVYAVVAANRTFRHKSKEWRRAYNLGYIPYNVFSTVMYGGFAVLLSLLFMQFRYDRLSMKQSEAALQAILDGLIKLQRADQGAIQAQVETAYGEMLLALGHVMGQLNTVFVFLLIIVIINVVVKFTPLRSVYVESSVKVTTYVTIGSLVIVLLIAFAMYFSSYADLVGGTLEKIASIRPNIQGDDWEILQRYNSVLIDLAKRRGVFGFVLALMNDSAGLVLVFGILNIGLSRLRKDAPVLPEPGASQSEGQ